MKSFVVVVCLFVSAYSLKKDLMDEMNQIMQKFGAECFASEHASEADLDDLMNKRVPSSHEGKCTIFCALKKLNIMKDDGSYGEGYVEWLEKAKVDDADFYTTLMTVYEVCQSKVRNDDFCEKAAELGLCAKNEGEKRGLIDFL